MHGVALGCEAAGLAAGFRNRLLFLPNGIPSLLAPMLPNACEASPWASGVPLRKSATSGAIPPACAIADCVASLLFAMCPNAHAARSLAPGVPSRMRAKIGAMTPACMMAD